MADAQRADFRGFETMSYYSQNGLPGNDATLSQCGVYVVVADSTYRPQFIEPNYARLNGNVIAPWSTSRLGAKWVPDSEVLYIGCAGTRSFRTLCQRLRDLLSHDNGNTTDRGPHKGGEILWQLRGYEYFRVGWLPTDGRPEQRDRERRLMGAFELATGKLPFANRHR